MKPAPIFAAMLMLAGCSTLQAPASAQDALKTAEQALTVAENAHTTTGHLLDAAVKAGLLHGANAALASSYYDRAGAALDEAEKADKAANAPGVLSAVSHVESLLGSASALVKGN